MTQQNPKPIVTQDYLETDRLELLHKLGIRIYQIIIKCFNWIVKLEQINIVHAILSLSRFLGSLQKGLELLEKYST